MRAIQRRHQLEQVNRVLAQHGAWHCAGVDPEGSTETIVTLQEMRAEIALGMQAVGQKPKRSFLSLRGFQ